MQDHYEVLGVPPAADHAEIKAAYRALARDHHPDVGDGADMTAINEAYAVLSDFTSRNDYDVIRRLFLKNCEVCDGSGVRWTQKGFLARDRRICEACSGKGTV